MQIKYIFDMHTIIPMIPLILSLILATLIAEYSPGVYSKGNKLHEIVQQILPA
jgi:hypothetical protein